MWEKGGKAELLLLRLRERGKDGGTELHLEFGK